MRSIDRFSLFAGTIGLVADFFSLGGLFLLSKADSKTPFFAWMIVLVSIVYTTGLVNFYARKKLHSIQLEIGRQPNEAGRIEEVKRVEKATLSMTLLTGMTLSICYAAAVFYLHDGYFYDPFYWRIGDDFVLTVVRGLCYGSFFGYMMCLAMDYMVLHIYKGFFPDYSTRNMTRH